MNIKNARQYIEHFLRIKTKDNKIVPFALNEPQQKLYDIIKGQHAKGKPIRLIILKARQMGFSTLTEGLIFHRTVNKKNVNSLIIAHKEDATTNLFRMSKLFYDELPDVLKPMRAASNAKELIFENPTKDPFEKRKNPGLRSKIKCSTAGGSGVGRSDTLSNVHASEYAFWEGDKKDTLNGLMQAVPNLPDTMVIIESTANGYDDFKLMWDNAVAGESDFIPVFFAWFEMQDYRLPYDGFELTDEEKHLKEVYNLDDEQIAWRRWCIKNNCGGDVDLFKQEYPASPEEAFISTGRCVFSKEQIALQLAQARKDGYLRRGRFVYDTCYNEQQNEVLIQEETIKWEDDPNGCITVYHDPEDATPYVIGGDTSGEGSDYFIGQVVNNITGEQVATLRHKFDEDTYARQMYCLGLHYNVALIGIEVNFSTLPIKELERLRYPRQFVRVSEDTYTHKVKQSFGFRTDKKTRPLIIGGLVKLARECVSLIHDVDTLMEMLTFVRNEQDRPEAEQGAHDDCVMALAIAHYIRQQQATAKPKETKKKMKWTPDMWEDYRNTSKEGKEYLMRKWGKPM